MARARTITFFACMAIFTLVLLAFMPASIALQKEQAIETTMIWEQAIAKETSRIEPNPYLTAINPYQKKGIETTMIWNKAVAKNTVLVEAK